MAPPNERRRHPRRTVKLMVEHHAPRARDAARDYATDLSSGGMFLRTSRRSTLGETLEVEIAPDSPEAAGKTIKAICEVTRVTPEGIGTHFTQLDPDSALLLNLIISV